MILAREDIVWIKHQNGTVAPFDEQLLARSIQDATQGVGHLDDLLSESIAAAVHLYALKCCSNRTISTDEISEIVVTVLGVLGYKEVSEAYLHQQRRAEIRLDDMAARLGPAIELEFYRLLDGELAAAADVRLSLLEICGLRACVMQLLGARRWHAGCRDLAGEIVNHVRARVARMRPPKSVSLKLAVLE